MSRPWPDWPRPRPSRATGPLPSAANFVLVLFEGALSAADAQTAIARAGYAVRHLPGQGLGHALRITVGTADDMDAVAAAIRDAAAAA